MRTVSFHLPRRAAAAAATAAAALAVAAAPATAAKTYNETVVATVKKASQKGTTLVYTGTVRSSVLGRGTVRQTVRLNGLNVTGSFTIRYKGGTVRGTVRAKARLGLREATFTGTSRTTGGTGRYKGATGSGSYRGTGALNMSGATFRSTGTITF